jgi:hypothetical protein
VILCSPLGIIAQRARIVNRCLDLSSVGLLALGWLLGFPSCNGGKLFHTDGTDTEQQQRADYFNVKEFPNPEWVWADYFQ